MFSILDQWRNISGVSVHLLTAISNPSLCTNFSTRSTEDPLELLPLLFMCACCRRGGYGCGVQRLMGNASTVSHSTQFPNRQKAEYSLEFFPYWNSINSLTTNWTTGQLPGHDYFTKSIIRWNWTSWFKVTFYLTKNIFIIYYTLKGLTTSIFQKVYGISYQFLLTEIKSISSDIWE